MLTKARYFGTRTGLVACVALIAACAANHGERPTAKASASNVALHGGAPAAQPLSDAVFRWIDNANAIARVAIGHVKLYFAELLLLERLASIEYDSGPHSLTRVVLRYRLWQLARDGDALQRSAALSGLFAAKERGVLLAIGEQAGDMGRTARRALFAIDHPHYARKTRPY